MHSGSTTAGSEMDSAGPASHDQLKWGGVGQTTVNPPYSTNTQPLRELDELQLIVHRVELLLDDGVLSVDDGIPHHRTWVFYGGWY